MPIDILLTFVSATLVIVLSPGPSCLLIANHSLQYGLAQSLKTIFGDGAACLVQMALSCLGVGAILSTSPIAFQIMKWVGFFFIFYIALKQWKSHFQGSEIPNSITTPTHTQRLFVQGFLISAFNPKGIMFFALFFPVFIDKSQSFSQQFTLLAGLFTLINFLGMFSYAFFSHQFRRLFKSKKYVTWQNKISALFLMIAAGMIFFLERA